MNSEAILSGNGWEGLLVGTEKKQHSDIIQFWRAVEYFEPTTIARPNTRRRSKPMLDLREEAVLPWDTEHRYQNTGRSRPGTQWRHTVYCGVFKLEEVQKLLEEQFGIDDEDADEYSPGQSALLAFDVDANGRALLETDAVSSCGWAVGRTLSPGPKDSTWLQGFEETQDRFRAVFEWLVTEPAPEPTRVLLSLLAGEAIVDSGLEQLWDLLEETLDAVLREDDGSDPEPGTGGVEPHGRRRHVLKLAELHTCLQLAARLSGAGEFIADDAIWVESRQVQDAWAAQEEARQEKVLQSRAAMRGDCDPPEESPEPGETVFLNSFIAEDLARVAQAVEGGDYGKALRRYLSSEQEAARTPRTDLRSIGAAALDLVSPGRTPLARWPSRDTHPLVLSQQIAVNSIVSPVEGPTGPNGLFAVNGPPGTGKTTLLRDLIAHVVVQRAHALARLAEPSDAFAVKSGWKTEDGETPIHALTPELTGFEIVVASANNGAVENVTAEIPSVDAIDEQWRGRTDYFSDIAQRVLKKPAWGTAAAQLGNMSNRSDFAQHFWRGGYGKKVNGRYVPPPGGMKELLSELKAVKRPKTARLRRWRSAVADFKSAVEQAEAQRAERAGIGDLDSSRRTLSARAAKGPAKVVRAEDELAQARQTAARTQRELELAMARAEGLRVQVQSHRHLRPSTLRTVASLGRSEHEWQEQEHDLLHRLARAEYVLTHSQEAMNEAESAVGPAEQKASAAARMVDDAHREFRELESSYDETIAKLGVHLPTPGLADDTVARELSSPWNDPEMASVRTEVFLAALRLHKAFLEAVPVQMNRNLSAAMTVLRGGTPSGAPREAVLAAWQSLFFVVPVVSTTFASFARLFQHVQQEELGWLLVDEAGQATPQQAVGALWRSRHAVVVGDPLQLEPICTLPFTAQQALRNRFEVEEKWLPAWSSVQTLADAVTPLGTELTGPDEDPIWVGAPLRVHRRCDDPMFSVCNEIAYNGAMVHGTPDKECGLYPSLWVDVPNRDGRSEGHWIPDEGKALRRILSYLAGQGQDMSRVFVIAPFREVAAKAMGIALSGNLGVSDGGTIHRTQGKEADVVIFVLGGDPRRPGAKRWAAKKPNLVNVAASRAKRRLYVIGDHSSWTTQPHFDTLAGHLRTWEIKL